MKHTILWADDDPDELILAQEAVEELDRSHQIIGVLNGLEVLDYLKNNELLPCVVILDMNMPLLDGKNTVYQMKTNERFARLPLVIYTTSRSDQDKDFCNTHQVEMITKPNTYSEVKQVVQKIINMCRHH